LTKVTGAVLLIHSEDDPSCTPAQTFRGVPVVVVRLEGRVMSESVDVRAWVRERRGAESQRDETDDMWGLALSGGGIRSAVFCYGLLRALARGQALSRFDVWSTVSGGGYIGSAIGKLFHHARSPQQVREVYDALASGDAQWFTWWLRANGRYLIPRGFKDSLYALAVYLQNFLGVHAELGMMVLLLGLVLVGFDFGVWSLLAAWPYAQSVIDSMKGVDLRWVPTAWLLLVMPAITALSLISASWCIAPVSRQDRRGVPRQMVLAPAALIVTALLFALAPTPNVSAAHKVVWLAAVMVSVGATLSGMASGWAKDRAIHKAKKERHATMNTRRVRRVRGSVRDQTRHELSSALAAAGSWAAAILAVGVVDRIAWFVAFEMEDLELAATLFVGTALLLRAMLPVLMPVSSSMRPLLSSWLAKLGNAFGWILLATVVVLWLALIDRMLYPTVYEDFGAWLDRRRYVLLVVLALLAFAWATRRNYTFLNQSSLHNFYRARITRGFLGAANGLRFPIDDQTCRRHEDAGRSPVLHALSPVAREGRRDPRIIVTEVHPMDDVEMSRYAPHRHGGPVHLINLCVNETTDRRGGLFNQDRRGRSMLIGPNAVVRVAARPWQPACGEGAGTLGRWTALSGAALAPGAGHLTRGGFSALATLIGLRLGFWWNSESLQARCAKHASGLADTHDFKFRGLLRELRGDFSADDGKLWYLSDGGHYENTGALALLAERAKLVVLADCGADPGYRFADLENLVRKARIDLNVDICFMRPDPTKRAAQETPIAGLEAFGTLDDLASNQSNACLALARIEYHEPRGRGRLVVIKPNLSRDAPADLVNFKADNPDFPQETTTDQSFSESQWESYFKLGCMLGGKLGLEFLESIDDWAFRCFVDERDVATWHKRQAIAKAPTQRTAAAASAAATAMVSATVAAVKDAEKQGDDHLLRLPSRIGSNTVATTLGAGAVLTLALSLWQAIDNSTHTNTQRDTNSRARNEFFRSYGEWNLDLQQADKLGKAAAASLQVIEGACAREGVDTASPMLRCMLVYLDAACKHSDEALRQIGCATLVSTPELACVIRPNQRQFIEYWHEGLPKAKALDCPVLPAIEAATRRGAAANGDAVKPAARPVEPPAGAAPGEPAAPAERGVVPGNGDVGGPQGASQVDEEFVLRRSLAVEAKPAPLRRATGACDGRTLVVQTYGQVHRPGIAAFVDHWRAQGANVPPAEDLFETARRNRRSQPAPTETRSRITYFDNDSAACAMALREGAGCNACASLDFDVVRKTEPQFQARLRTVEVRVAPTRESVWEFGATKK
jgi:Patatin-like phospholipase